MRETSKGRRERKRGRRHRETDRHIPTQTEREREGAKKREMFGRKANNQTLFVGLAIAAAVRYSAARPTDARAHDLHAITFI